MPLYEACRRTTENLMALEDLIREEILDAADCGEPDMTSPEAEALVARLARRLRPLFLGQESTTLVRFKAEEPTRRQLQILEMLADSRTPSWIASALGLCRGTVRDHVRALARRWDVSVDPCVLVNAAFERHWLAVSAVRPVVSVDPGGVAALGLIAAGRELEIGVVLGLSEDQVASQRTLLMLGLGASTDAGLVAAAWRAGLLPVAPAPSSPA